MKRHACIWTVGALLLILGCKNQEIFLVNDSWQIVEMATAHGAFTIEVEVIDRVDTWALARELIEPLQDDYAEILVYFHRLDAEAELPLSRIQWTVVGGYTETRYGEDISRTLGSR